MSDELKLYEVRRDEREFVQPTDLCRLARAGVRLLPSSRLLLAQVPAGLTERADWPELERLLTRHARSLQLMADQVASTLSQADVAGRRKTAGGTSLSRPVA